MFDGLNAIPWYDLKHAYGSAEEVPMWLRQLASEDEQLRQHALYFLSGSICHQGWICSATAYAVPYLLELVAAPSVQGKDGILELLAAIAAADPLEEATWRENSQVPVWNVPAHIPFKDAHAEVSVGFPLYGTLLDDPALPVRMQAAYVLASLRGQAQEIQQILLAAYQREPILQARANLLLALGLISLSLAEASQPRAFFQDVRQAGEHDALVFSAALVLTRMMKEETPQEAAQVLADVMAHSPETLKVYEELPCGGGQAAHAAQRALYLLGPVRLHFTVPLIQQLLAQATRYEAFDQAELLLFIFFGKKPHRESQQQLRTVTERQRQLLLLFFEKEDLWRSGNFSLTLRAYGLPATRQAMADFLGQALQLVPPVLPPAFDSQPQRNRPAQLRDLLRLCYPDLRIRMMESRSNSDLITVNREIIFRYPNQPETVQAMAREVALLQLLEGRVPLPIPAPLYVNLGDHEVDRACMGYALLPGKPLYKEMLESLDGEEEVQAIADQLAAFLKALHHISLGDLAELGLPEQHSREQYGTFYKRIRETLFPHLQPEVQAQVTAHFETFLDDQHTFAITPALVHGHFGPSTILYDAEVRAIGGIAGFRHAGPGDPASDFALLLGPHGYGEDFVRSMERLYPMEAAFYERARFYAEAHTLREMLLNVQQTGSTKVTGSMTFYANERKGDVT